MISPTKLIKMARKWQKLAASKRKSISLPRNTGVVDPESCSTSPIVEKGHFVVYTADQRRFMIPLIYLGNNIIRELFTMAEDEFGLPDSQRIILPCDAVFMEYAISLIQGHVTKDVEKALLMSLTTGRCLTPLYHHQEQSNQKSLLCGY